MNDEFLHEFRESPRPGFTIDLYARLQTQGESALTRGYRPRQVASIAAGLVLLFLGSSLIIPSVRGQAQALLRQIGERVYEETEQYPFSRDGILLESRQMTLEEANQILPDPIRLPQWIVPGFQQEASVTVLSLPEVDPKHSPVSVMWYHTDESGQLMASVWLHVQYIEGMAETARTPFQAGPAGSVQAVEVNQQPAALIRGAWNADTEVYDSTSLLMLHWQRGGYDYVLSGYGPAVTVEDLMRMAESIPTP